MSHHLINDEFARIYVTDVGFAYQPATDLAVLIVSVIQ
jgi:hypothetical protein